MDMLVIILLGFVVQLVIYVMQHGGIYIDVEGAGKVHSRLKKSWSSFSCDS